MPTVGFVLFGLDATHETQGFLEYLRDLPEAIEIFCVDGSPYDVIVKVELDNMLQLLNWPGEIHAVRYEVHTTKTLRVLNEALWKVVQLCRVEEKRRIGD